MERFVTNTVAEEPLDAAVPNTVSELAQKNEEVRATITETLLEIDHIVLQVNPQIESTYALKIGCFENELAQAQLAARRAKRRYTLAMARTNVGKQIDTAELDAILDEEFVVWEKLLAQQLEDYVQKMERRMASAPLNPADAKEIRSLHRELVKRLHSDLHPNQTDEEARMFAMVQDAYEKGDLETLRSLESATAYLVQEKTLTVKSYEVLYAEYELLCAQLRVTQDRLEFLKSTEPYTFKELLEDANWVHRRTTELKKEIEVQQAVKASYDQRFKELTEA